MTKIENPEKGPEQARQVKDSKESSSKDSSKENEPSYHEFEDYQTCNDQIELFLGSKRSERQLIAWKCCQCETPQYICQDEDGCYAKDCSHQWFRGMEICNSCTVGYIRNEKTGEGVCFPPEKFEGYMSWNEWQEKLRLDEGKDGSSESSK